MAGRPSTYTPEIGDKICGLLADGQSLARIIKENQDVPCFETVYRWMRLHPDFNERYARARDDQADTLADEITAISDEEVHLLAGQSAGVAVQRNRLRVDARKWVASKLKPKKYGDKQEIDVTDSRLVKAILEALPVEMAEQVRTAITERSGGQRKLAVVSGK